MDEHCKQVPLKFGKERKKTLQVRELVSGDMNHTFAAAQDAFLQRAKANSEAQLGTYKGGAGGDQDLFETKYKY
jgi:fructose-bisphosphate aldolase class I